jgi:hypothetical protein
MVEPGIYSMTEVLAPTMIDYATPELAAAMVPRLLRGDETWCQGFSEPGTGSNLASLSCRATRTADGWRVTGQKVWTSLAQFADRCVLLTRTGTPDSAHKGITALFVDMDSPGITVRPIETMHGAAEFSEVFFDDVAVPFDRTLGEEGQGWAVAMDLLPYERSTALWHRAAFLHRRLERLLRGRATRGARPRCGGRGGPTPLCPARPLEEHATTAGGGEHLGPETSIDKVLVATAEQAVFDLVADGLSTDILIGGRSDQRALAPGVPLLAGGDDLRRDGGDPAQHHRPPAPRPRAGPMMDPADRILFERSLEHAVADAQWSAARRRAPRARMARRAGARPADGGGDPLQAPGLGTRFVLVPGPCPAHRSGPEGISGHRCRPAPYFGQWAPPGALDGDDLVVRGLGSAALPTHKEALVVARTGGQRSPRLCPRPT